MAPLLLHGTLDGTIFEAKFNNPFDKFLQGLPRFEGQPTGAQIFTTVELDGVRVGRTRVIDQDFGNPKWNEPFYIYCAHTAAEVVFSVKVQMPVGVVEPVLASASVPVQDLLSPGGQLVDRWVPLLAVGGRPLPNAPQMHVQVRFTDAAADPQCPWGAGIGSAQHPGVPRTFFRQRRGCRVTLYQDAHVRDAFKPSVQLAGGRAYEQRRCWEDIYDAIADARHLVYITGWSVFPGITLVRDGDRRRPGGGVTLGELLKRKAKEGVRVLMMVWDDPSSPLNLGLFPGLGGSNDADCFKYFRGSAVQCVPCPRNRDPADNVIQGLKVWGYSHHQKSVVVDVKDGGGGGGGLRRIAAFIGGLDLTSGRYDTPEHSLFRTLNAAHGGDFYQGNIPGASLAAGGPREPWHDIHCRVEGPAAWDVLHNFEQRWGKQGGKGDLIQNVPWPWHNNKDVLLDLRGMEGVISPESAPVLPPDDKEAWNVQVFRSVDSSTCNGFPRAPAEAALSGVVNGKDHLVDRSIQDAYIHAIRRARDFIYIENQYFLGSSFGWHPDGVTPEEIGALHLVPKELSLKIVSKIRAGERFAVYIVIPMWPEGDPSSWKIQTMLHWQTKTIDMMYRDIAAALKETPTKDASVMDYLRFFCLGNRELQLTPEYVPKDHPAQGSDYDRAQKARRSMVYVHSKLMIVDDEYIIIGSANINQRSMDGGRDTEIAMGAYQPFHLSTDGPGARRGQVHGLRMSLWYEHLGVLKDEFQDPGSLKCIRMVGSMADGFWKRYSDTTVSDIHGHLLSYPVEIGSDGEVLERVKVFPDTNAESLGNLSTVVNLGGKLLTAYILTT